jgi:hypothetical protein
MVCVFVCVIVYVFVCVHVFTGAWGSPDSELQQEQKKNKLFSENLSEKEDFQVCL